MNIIPTYEHENTKQIIWGKPQNATKYIQIGLVTRFHEPNDSSSDF